MDIAHFQKQDITCCFHSYAELFPKGKKNIILLNRETEVVFGSKIKHTRKTQQENHSK